MSNREAWEAAGDDWLLRKEDLAQAEWEAGQDEELWGEVKRSALMRDDAERGE